MEREKQTDGKRKKWRDGKREQRVGKREERDGKTPDAFNMNMHQYCKFD